MLSVETQDRIKKRVKYSKEEANDQGPLWAWGGGRGAPEPASPEPLFDQRGRHYVSSAKDQETQLDLWTPDRRGLSQGKDLVFCCVVKFAFHLMNCAWGKGLKEAWVWCWFFFLGRWGSLPLYKNMGLSNYCVLGWALHLAIKTWRFPVFSSRLDVLYLSACQEKLSPLKIKRKKEIFSNQLIWNF